MLGEARYVVEGECVVKEIGGYFELDPGGGDAPLPNGVLLNSGRNALRHIVRQLKIKSIWVPEYTCPVVWDALRAEKCELRFYSIGLDMLPTEKMPRNDFILYTNYFGCCGKKVEMLAAEYPNLIVDCAQAYHAQPKGRASFYSPRKFFGVADGGIAFGVDAAVYEQDDSSARQQHLIVRKEKGASAGYPLFQAAEKSLVDAPILAMSVATTAALQKFDAAVAIRRRRENFAFLHERLQAAFPLALADDDVPMVYPYVTDDATLRLRLIAKNVFVAKYWPDLDVAADVLAKRILPVPIDHRYCLDEMRRVIEAITVGSRGG